MKKRLNELKKIIIKTAYRTKEGHIASSFSALDILWVLYERILNYNPRNPRDPKRDRFILSKGHASLGLYTILAEKKFFPTSYLANYCSYNSPLGGHPDRNKVPGIEASTGSLGHGFPISVGIALGLRIKKKTPRVITLIGDGECNEGTIWESALLASHHKLSNLTCIVDYNHSTDRALSVGNFQDKFKSFGWDSISINGHDHIEIYNALKKEHDTKPLAVVAKTIKGCGCKMMEDNPAWHHRVPTEEEVDVLMHELS